MKLLGRGKSLGKNLISLAYCLVANGEVSKSEYRNMGYLKLSRVLVLQNACVNTPVHICQTGQSVELGNS